MRDAYPIVVAGLVLAASSVCSPGTNHPPRIGPVPDLSVVVGDLLSQPLVAEDPDGDSVSFEVHGAPEGARVLAETSGAWRFEYAPLASHAGPGGRTYDLMFAAVDGRGGRTEEATTLTVWPEASVPVFVGPFAWALNLSEADHVAALVRVRDDDTAQVALVLRHGVEGARLDPVDGHSATFYFRPRPSQVAAGAVFTVTVGASDGDHPEVLQDFAVVLVNADLFGGCPGNPPSAFHAGLGDQHEPGPYALEVATLDPDSRVRKVTAFWTAVKGLGEEEMNRLDLEGEGGGVFRGAIPDLSAAGGTGRLVFYHFRLSDDDDPTGDSCDHGIRWPPSGEFAVAVYGPEAAGMCLDDDLAGAAVPVDLPRDASGLRLCGGQADEFGVDLLAGEWVAVVVRAMSGGGLPWLEVRDPSGTPVAKAPGGVLARAGVAGRYGVTVTPPSDLPVTYALMSAIVSNVCPQDPFEPDQGSHPPASLPEGEFQATLCPADVDDYRFVLEAGEAATVTVRPAAPDADLALTLFEEGVDLPLRTAPAIGTERRVLVEADRPLVLVARVSSGSLREVAYDIALDIAGQGVVCDEDLLGPCPTWDEAPTLFEATWEKLKLCPGKADFFQTGFNGGETLSVAVEAEPGRTAPGLAVLAGDGQTVLADGARSGNLALAEVVAPGPGPLYFRVGPAGDTAETYSLSFWTREPPGDCQPDRMEPNDEAAEAASLPAGFTTHLTLCPGDRDVFALRMGAFETVTALLLFGTIPAHLSLLDGAGGVLADGTPAEYGEELLHVASQPTTVYLVVATTVGDGWYDIGVEVE